MDDVLAQYKALGLPGCIGSMDCTHLHWDKCPTNLTNLCTGKEGFPSLSFEVIVDHNRRIHHCTPGYYGSHNDQTISKYDLYAASIEVYGKFSLVEYVVKDASGRQHIMKGLYLIVDGGYRQVQCYMEPHKERMS